MKEPSRTAQQKLYGPRESWRWSDQRWKRQVSELVEGAIALAIFFGILALIAFGWAWSETEARRDECDTFWNKTGYRTEFDDGPAQCYVVIDSNHSVPLQKFEVEP
jgi:hypothetical protein